MPALPHKDPGQPYSVVFRTEDFSWGNLMTRGALGTSDVIPVPQLGDLCVCCNTRTHRFLEHRPSDTQGHFNAKDPLLLPICHGCAAHAMSNQGASVVAAATLMSGIGLTMLGGLGYWHWLAAVGGGVLLLGSGAWLWLQRQRRLAHSVGGHQPGLEVTAHPRQLVIRTFNRAFAQRLVDANGERVHAVK